MVIQDILKQFGLNQKETLVYLTALRIGTETATTISEESRLNRSTTYVILRGLVEQGIIMQSLKNKVTMFSAVPPERIVSLMEFRAKQYAQMAEQTQKLIPELRSMMNTDANTPTVQIYEGKKGMQTAYEDTLTATTDILAYASVDDTENTLPGFFPDYYKRRAKKGIHIDAIFPHTEKAVALHKRDTAEDRTSLLVPEEQYAFTPEINIYNNKVAFFSWKDTFAMIIESEEMAEAQRKIFALAWEQSKQWEKLTCPVHKK